MNKIEENEPANILTQTFGEQRRWINWKTATVDGRPTKVPCTTDGTTAAITNTSVWRTYKEVIRASKKIGIIFTPDQTLLGIDIDHCLEGNAIVHEEKENIERIINDANTYTEISPSGTGLHLFLSLTAPLELVAKRHGNCEAYTSGRYFTVTNNPYGEVRAVRTVTPDEAVKLLSIIGYPWGKKEKQQKTVVSVTPIQATMPQNDEVILSKMFASKNGTAIKSLYDGDTSAHNNDDSIADAALCSHFAFWTGKDESQMERLWLTSPLGQREKTTNRKDYRDRTISFAVSNCNEVYKGDTHGYETNEDVTVKCQAALNSVPQNTAPESILKAITPILDILATEVNQAEAEIYIRNKVKNHFEPKIKTKDLDSIVKFFKEMRFQAQIKMEESKKKAAELEEEPPLTEEEKRGAENALKSPTLLYDVLKMVKKLGVVGEEKNVLLHYLILTSRKLKHPLSATVKGDSSSGKSYTLLSTVRMFPKSAYIDLTDATPQSFFYCPEDHFKHKIIIIFEKHGGERSDYAIRTLQSEGKLKIQVTVKNPETGQFEAQTIEKEGPTGFVTTTTASVIHSENDTRNISMFPDQSSEQTSRVYESVDARYSGTPSISDTELKPWHHAQLTLEQFPVYIPFVRSFRKHFPKHIIRTRRDYGHFLAIVESVVFLHQKQREKMEVNGQTYIKATLADAYMAKAIVEDSLSKSIYELPEKSIEVIEKARELVKEENDEFGDSDAKFTVTALSKSLGWDRDTVAKWLKPACKKGYVTVAEESKGSKGAKYTLEEKELPGDTFLPSIEDLIADNPDESTINIYNPLTGESVTIEKQSESPCTDAPTESSKEENALVNNVSLQPIGASVENYF